MYIAINFSVVKKSNVSRFYDTPMYTGSFCSIRIVLVGRDTASVCFDFGNSCEINILPSIDQVLNSLVVQYSPKLMHCKGISGKPHDSPHDTALCVLEQYEILSRHFLGIYVKLTG